MEKHIIKIIKKQVYKVLPNSKIILFGSRARNDQNIDSDYDILIATKETLPLKTKREYRSKIRKSLLKFDILSDILIQSFKEIEKKRKLTGHIIKNVIKEGVVL